MKDRPTKLTCHSSIRYSKIRFLSSSYRSRFDANVIEYKKFCDEIESIFTTDFLEKNPLVDSEQYVAIKEAHTIRLDPDKEDRVKHLMNKIGERVSNCWLGSVRRSFRFIRINVGSSTSIASLSIIRRFRPSSKWLCDTKSISTCLERFGFIIVVKWFRER
jgi:hypothetical protein